jgi:serine/threonine protein kinase
MQMPPLPELFAKSSASSYNASTATAHCGSSDPPGAPCGEVPVEPRRTRSEDGLITMGMPGEPDLSLPCPNCGRLNRPGARYCASCQTALGTAVAVARAQLQPGQMLDGGTYRVVRPLGKGGMGAVWLVAQTKAFDRLAVLKEVIDYFDPTDGEERRKALQRFEEEARTLGALKHPGIPDLYAYFSEAGHNYLVMEYIEGQDLRLGLTGENDAPGRPVAGGGRPGDEVLRYAIQICEVLEYLASRQPPIVHNDIKPGNIIVDQHSGRAVLVDFGTAKTRYIRAGGGPDKNRDSLYGTVGYAAPELFQGHSEPRSDVYSLAATAYHLLTDDDPRDHPLHYPQLETMPPSLADILRRALAQEVAARPTARQFRQDLEAYLAGQTGPLQPLSFPGGGSASSREELLSLAVKHWGYTAGLLQDGTLVRWLRGTLHDALAVQTAEGALHHWPGDPDAALDAFLRQLAPSLLPPPTLALRTPRLDLPAVGVQQKVVRRIEITNPGPGYLRGEVFGSQPWIKVPGGTFTCPPGQGSFVPVEIDPTGLSPNQDYVGAVTLRPAQGSPEVVAVQIRVIAPDIQIVPPRLDFGIVFRQDRRTQRQSFRVRNVSQAVAECRVVGAPTWLRVAPETFRLQPRGERDVDLFGEVSRLTGRRHEVTLTITVTGGASQQVAVALRLKGGLFGG